HGRPWTRGDGGDAVGRGDEVIPCATAGIDDVVVGLVDAQGELVLAHIFPDIFDRIEFRRVGRQVNQRDVFWDHEFAGDMPSSAIQNERRVTALGDAT